MNTPNKLTLLRIALVPFFLLFFALKWYPLALFVYLSAALTDMADGAIARKNGLVTDFGKFLDPLADKILVMSALVTFIEALRVSSLAILIILAREFLVTSLRLVAAPRGVVIAADNLGKLKTTLQMIWVIGVLLYLSVTSLFKFSDGFLAVGGVVIDAFLWMIVAVTVLSGANYIYRNRELLTDL